MKARLFFTVAACMLLGAVSMHAQTMIIKGSSKYGDVLYNFDGKNFRKGDSQYSKVLYNWDGQYIRQGQSQYGDVLYNFDGQYVRTGKSPYSKELLNISGKIPIGMLIFLLM